MTITDADRERAKAFFSWLDTCLEMRKVISIHQIEAIVFDIRQAETKRVIACLRAASQRISKRPGDDEDMYASAALSLAADQLESELKGTDQ